MYKERTCTWCGRQAIRSGESCPDCKRRFQDNELQDVTAMTYEERAAELATYKDVLEIDFSLLIVRINALVGRAVLTHELARWDDLVDETRTQRRPSLGRVLNIRR